ncbi:glycosyltransferase family 4 protein [Nocardia wallacei]|uniref:glycosyltransferase family 4 protein n=1 Tax=Nocardia wallacei TaxID=480035 RepID=UPI00245756B0|nr:glycosyltransferase family 4 protein [Nocardia wallacei]
MNFPRALHILTYDMAGTVVATGRPKPCRHTDLVTHTHQLLVGLRARHPGIRWAITQTGARQPGACQLRTPEGILVFAQGVRTGFTQYLVSASGHGKDPDRVHHFYEDAVDNPANPVYGGLARQYAHVIATAAMRNVLAQNVNPLVSILKAEQFGRLRTAGVDRLAVTGVIHDLAGIDQRLDYVRRRLDLTEHSVQLVATSTAVTEHLLKAGIPRERVHMVPNGLDVAAFLARLQDAAAHDVFSAVAQRNQLPAGRMILMSAHRATWNGHLDLIEAARILADRGSDAYIAITGDGAHDGRAAKYTRDLFEAVAAYRLWDKVFLLDTLSPREAAACARAAYAAVLPARDLEAFGYSSIEAMLARTPVVATAHGGALDYVDDGRSGLLVPPGAPQALAAALGRLLEDRGLHDRLARAGRASAARFDLGVMAAGFADVIAGHAIGDRP